METVLIQLWEISNHDNIISDGCSIHIDKINRDSYINDNPDNVEKTVGLPTEVRLSNILYKKLKVEKNIRLSEIETNNLLGLKEIEVC